MRTFKHLTLFFIFLLGMSMTSCNKEPEQVNPGTPKKMEDLKVPAGFNWESSRVVNLDISVDLPSQIGLLSKITIYDGNPTAGGNTLITGSAGYNFPFISSVNIPTALKELYFEMKTGDGTVQIVNMAVADQMSYTFTQVKTGKEAFVVSEPDCSTGCDVTVTGTSVNVKDGLTYCITGNWTGSVTFTSGTLKVCSGSINLGDLNMGSNCTLVATSGAVVTAGEIKFSGSAKIVVYETAQLTVNNDIAVDNKDGKNTKLINYSVTGTGFLIKGPTQGNKKFGTSGSVENYGKMTIERGYIQEGGTAVLINSGNTKATLTVDGDFNGGGTTTNLGSILVTGDVNNNNGYVLNSCKWIVNGKFYQNNTTWVNDAGYLRVDDHIYIQGQASDTAKFIMKNGSLLVANNYTQNRDVLGLGSASVIKIPTSDNNARINSNNMYVNGPVQMLTPNGGLQKGSSENFINGATLKKTIATTVSIPKTDCNPEGNQPPTPGNDRDGDGVPDDLDDYPDDPTRAYNNYWPGKDKYGTLSYEDLWPSKGDYDMNDMVIDCNFWYITNANNKVVDVKPTFYVRAVGAYLQNGFGWQFNGVLPQAVASVTGQDFQFGYIDNAPNGTENNQEKAVIIAWDNAENVINRVGGTYYNTEKNSFYGISDTVRINLHFETPQNQSDVGTPPYNPFIIKNMQRNTEIHLPDHKPTSLMDMSLFGTGDDDSNPAAGRYYKTKDNSLPWAICIPDRFDYTWENVQIVYGHLKFGAWAESGGISYPDWYKDLTGYRDATQIYQKP